MVGNEERRGKERETFIIREREREKEDKTRVSATSRRRKEEEEEGVTSSDIAVGYASRIFLRA